MENQTSVEPEKSKLRMFWDALPLLQWIGGGIVALCAAWTTIQLTQNSQAAELRETKNKVAALELQVNNDVDRKVTREVFDERTNAILKQLEVNRKENREDLKNLENRLDRQTQQPYPLPPQN